MKRFTLTVSAFIALLLVMPCGGKTQEIATYSLAIVPQLRVSELVERWSPFVEKLSRELHLTINIRPYNNMDTFEKDLSAGVFDFAYMNPYQMAINQQGYIPLIRDATDLTGIIVVHKGVGIDSIKDLDEKEIAFPTPQAFAASLYMRALLSEKEKLHFTPRYVKTHGNVYAAVASKTAAAGGGIMKTLMQAPEEIRNNLTILYTTPATASHPLAVHPRIVAELRSKVVDAILKLANDKDNAEMFNDIQIPEPVVADYQQDYLPLTKLHIK